MTTATPRAQLARLEMLQLQQQADKLRAEARRLTQDAKRKDEQARAAARQLLACNGYTFNAGI